ncbi:MAG: sensor histidine kinase [Candidatus Brocadiia bacterium]
MAQGDAEHREHVLDGLLTDQAPDAELDLRIPDPRRPRRGRGFAADARSVRKVGGSLRPIDEGDQTVEAALLGLEPALPAAPRPEAPQPEAAPQAEDDAARLQALAELGELCAVVAHEFRSPLAGISATAEVVREGLPPGHEGAEGLDVILGETERLARMVRNLLDFARSRQPQLLPSDVADDVGPVLRALRPLASRQRVRVEVEEPERCTPVQADSELIQQAFRNLATNALQAMPRGGTLSVRIRQPEPGSDFVCVEFADTGRGIERRHLPRIFAPFFTTRAGGVGLGLAVTRKLIEQQGGHVTVESRPGEGTRFTVYLRRADAAQSGS